MALCLCALCVAGCKANVPPAPRPPIVVVAPVARRDVALYLDAVASVDGYVDADIPGARQRVPQIADLQGGPVKRGQVLFSIEPTDYVAAVNVARAAVSRASVARAHNELEARRDESLFRGGSVAQNSLDDATAVLADTDGQVASARALLDQATLSLS